MSKKTPLKINFKIDPNARPATVDDYCRTFANMNAAAFVKVLQIGGNAWLDEQIEKLKSKTPKEAHAQ